MLYYYYIILYDSMVVYILYYIMVSCSIMSFSILLRERGLVVGVSEFMGSWTAQCTSNEGPIWPLFTGT